MAKLEKKDVDREHRKFVLNWLPKYVERLTIDLMCLKDKTEIPEGDWEVIECAFRNYYMGYCPDFIPAWQPPVKTVKQADLFTDKITEESGSFDDHRDKMMFGTDIVTTLSEPIIFDDEKV